MALIQAIDPTRNRTKSGRRSKKRIKRAPVGWMGPARGSGLTSRGKGRWDVIDSRGTRIAAGFDTREYANRWIDSFNLLQAGHSLNDRDHEWFAWHWLSWLPKRAPLTDQPTKVPTVTGDHRQQIRASVTHNTRCHETR